MQRLVKPLWLTNGLSTIFLPLIFSMPGPSRSGERRHATHAKQNRPGHHSHPTERLTVRISDRSTDEQYKAEAQACAKVPLHKSHWLKVMYPADPAG